jgi:hypothetical protein
MAWAIASAWGPSDSTGMLCCIKKNPPTSINPLRGLQIFDKTYGRIKWLKILP